MKRQAELDAAIRAARAAGQALVGQREQFGVLKAVGKDLKSSADLAAERAIFEILDPLGIATLSEESRADASVLEAGRYWVVDPLDGTLNYTRGLPLFCVSIALVEQGQPVLGVIYEPLSDRLYSGCVGAGAWCNGEPMSVADVADPGQAVLCTGFPSGRSYDVESLTEFVASVRKFKKVRLLGSAALCLAFVAAGHVDAYCEDDIWLWDVAAGLALVQAAGGQVQFGPWDENLKSRVIATNGRLSVEELRA